MPSLKLWFVIPLAFSAPALAQGTMQQGAAMTIPTQRTAGVARTPVATQPLSSDPFRNPIGQGVSPAVSANSNRNGNWINVPPDR
jgi:hypothetical protein